MGTSDSQIITNKSFNDTQTTFQYTSVNAKKMQFSCANITTGQTRTLSAPDYNGTIACSINSQYINYFLSSNGTSAMWNSVTSSVIGDFALSSVAQNDYLGANLSTVNSMTTLSGVYYFTTNITSRTLLNGDPNISRVAYGGGKYVALYNPIASTLIQVYIYHQMEFIIIIKVVQI